MINRNSKIPVYQQIAAQIREAIEAGRYGAGDRLPSEAELQREHGVARLTARRAYKFLADEGLVEIVQARGAFVADQAECA